MTKTKDNGNLSQQEAPIASSAHLASGPGGALSEVEYGIILSGNAMQRWVVRCMVAAGAPKELNFTDALALHNLHSRQRAKRLADICFTLNIEDSHTVGYALRKLAKLDLISSHKQGKETFFEATDKGSAICERYREIRQQCLVGALGDINKDDSELHELARLLRTLSGLYDQAARAAASL